ncbi:hypothetical protein ETD86_46455 [Nonomuraea turkmeniaca]|uniref:Uncharacterized protein n=1 Tax=Nonomuraea turkmeniaca TaxID=103838 RepID=A0A5S4FI91_9ACTN|nr:hypothetical protein [Nonomuraea turkmeniaca]TMR08755.1 hypothetical protein ETD86_46455 [Nonomuraea turkmeniaca]
MRFLSMAFVGAALVAGFAVPAHAAGTVQAAGTAQTAGTAQIAGNAPSCVDTYVYRQYTGKRNSLGEVMVKTTAEITNNCKNSVKVKVAWSWSPDSNCRKISKGKTISESIVKTHDRKPYQKTKSC